MAYSADSFVADEQPTTAKWNKLWSNDAAFNDGTGIANNAITASHISGISKANLTTDYNPYKFGAWRNAAQNTAAGSVVVVYDTELFDTNNNYDTFNGRYTAPVDGFYAFGGNQIVSHGANGATYNNILKNGAEIKRFHEEPSVASGNWTTSGATFLQLVATDYVQLAYTTDAVRGFVTGNSAYTSGWGFLVSKT